MNNRPKLYGFVTTDNPSGTFTRLGRVALWKQNVAPATKRPPLTGTLELHGKKYKIALWENTGE